MNNIELRMADLDTRLKRLEQAVMGTEKLTLSNKNTTTKFSGIKGGILLLLGKRFFSEPKTSLEVTNEMKLNSYFYHRDRVQTALNRLATKQGPLTSILKNKIKAYVERK